jgi:Bifunctional DNA primase/polymerase, N-terminal
MSGEDTCEAARRYIKDLHLAIIPVPKAAKSPGRDDWQNERHTLEDVERLWSNGQGIGCLWGVPSHGFCDVDLDWHEASIAADEILPRTRTFGRPDSPKSHRIFLVTDEVPKTKKFVVSADEAQGGGRMVVELLSTGAQSLLPPSWHESGQKRSWYAEGKSVRIKGQELVDAVADIASAALIARNWPGEGARHEYSLAAAGFLFRHLPPERPERTMLAAIRASGDEESYKRTKNVQTTRERLENGSNTTGGTTLESLSPGLVKRLRSWHGWAKKERLTGSDPHQNGEAPTHDELRDRFIEKHPQLGYGLGVWRSYGNGVWPAVEEYQVQDGVCRVLEDAKPENIRPSAGLLRSVAELTRIRVAKPDEIWIQARMYWSAKTVVCDCRPESSSRTRGSFTQPRQYRLISTPTPQPKFGSNEYSESS